MPLNWKFAEGDPERDVPTDFWIEAGRLGTIVNPVYQSIIFDTMTLGINDIKDEDTAREFFRRECMMARALNRAPAFTLEDVRKCIGLRTNAGTLTYPKFKTSLIDHLEIVAYRALNVDPVE